MYLWEKLDWPTFSWDEKGLTNLLAEVCREHGRLLDGFEGKLTTSKWAKLAKCIQDTAFRDILNFIERGALQNDPGGGRSTSYFLVS